MLPRISENLNNVKGHRISRKNDYRENNAY